MSARGHSTCAPAHELLMRCPTTCLVGQRGREDFRVFMQTPEQTMSRSWEEHWVLSWSKEAIHDYGWKRHGVDTASEESCGCAVPVADGAMNTAPVHSGRLAAWIAIAA